jgi:hypothetical protein
MSRANRVSGRIETHGRALGTPTEDMVRERAREIALTNGRPANQFTQADLDQAREELSAAQNQPEGSEPVTEQNVEYDPGTANAGIGHRAPTKLPTDEQAYAEQLVTEGVDEAAHEQAVEGNKESRRRDENYEDQLPSNED